MEVVTDIQSESRDAPAPSSACRPAQPKNKKGETSKLVREAGCISDSRQPVACETVAAPIDGPAQETGNLTHSINFATRSGGDNMAFHSSVRSQPRGESRLYRNDSSSRTFGLCGFHVDVPAG